MLTNKTTKNETVEKKSAAEYGGTRCQAIGNHLKLACNIGVYLFLIALVVCYPFYLPEGYIRMITHKFQFFRTMCVITAAVMIPLAVLYYLVSAGNAFRVGGRKGKLELSLTDLFVLFFAWANLTSYFSSGFQEEALWGTENWWMGFLIYLFLIGIYFLISRFYDNRIDVLPVFMAVNLIICLWGVLNRFSVFPVDMHYYATNYISCMGNIDWFCGYFSASFSIGTVLYMITEKKWMRVFSGICVMVSLGAGVTAGADSAFLAMGAGLFFLFLAAFHKTRYMKRFLETGILLCAVCQILYLVSVFWPESLNYRSFLMDLMLGNVTRVGLVVLIVLRIVMGRQEKRIPKYGWIKYVACGFCACLFLLYLALLIANTKNPGSIGFLSGYPEVFLFDLQWGGSRGATWMDGIAIFQSLPGIKRLFGVGPDCYSAYAYGIPELAERMNREWDNFRCTNAHNECLTYLVNTGVLGMTTFIGIFVSAFVRLVRKAGKEPLCYVFAACLLSYFCHNQFSFAQLESTPYIFMMLGLGENLLRRSS
ncbi:MAG: O-antigen ligase family protein [Blautia sp.]|nr:O-antigen ligase family protein [Blautia sp.]